MDMTPHVLTREQVEVRVRNLDEAEAAVLLDHDAAQRETIRRLEGERDAEKDKLRHSIQDYCELERAIEALGVTLTDDYGALDPREELTKFVADLQARLTASEAKGKWTTARPTKAGWYWFRNTAWPDEAEPRVIYVRDYAGHLAIGNCRLEGFKLYETGEWQGPLTPGEE